MDNSKAKEKDNIHHGHRKRMQAKFAKGGIDSLEDHEILEILLYYVHRTKDTNPIGHRLMRKFKTLDRVFSATAEELCSVEGIGNSGAGLLTLIGQLNNRISRSTLDSKVRFSGHDEAADYCCRLFRGLKKERLVLISLNSSRDVIDTDVVSDGACNATTADVRKIVELAMMRKASGVVLVHNHPGDCPHPSSADISATARIISVLEGINVSVVDHIICSEDKYCSMAERGILDSL